MKLPAGNELRNFCHAHSGKEFINQWFEFLFEYSEKVCEANKNMYREVFPKLTEEKREQFIKILDRCYQSSNVIGFNSGKFDMNSVLSHLDCTKYKVKSPIGSISAYKMIIITRCFEKTGDKKVDERLKQEANKNCRVPKYSKITV